MKLAPWEQGYDLKEEIRKLQHKARGRYSNNSGLELERMIIAACQQYEHNGRAFITKVPEPFKVLYKKAYGRAIVQFTEHAQPDFIGVLRGGQCICFESKYTSSDKLKYAALTDTQAKSLKTYWELGAYSGVCCGIGEKYYMIPWIIFGNMKELFGRLYVTHEDVKEYEVRFNGAVMFLDKKSDYQNQKAKSQKKNRR